MYLRRRTEAEYTDTTQKNRPKRDYTSTSRRSTYNEDMLKPPTTIHGVALHYKVKTTAHVDVVFFDTSNSIDENTVPSK